MTTQHRQAAAGLPLKPSELLTTEQVATILGLSTRTLATWRSSGRNPLPYIKVGSRVRYQRQDVMAWLESRRTDADTSALEVA
ncbi:Helix-turn-helix domain protein [compost metagenome]